MASKQPNDNDRDWLDTLIKVLTPVIVGLVVAYVGYLSNKTLSEVSSKQESARLVTELQVRREQSESELRKDIFNQTLKTFLLENAQLAQDYSKQILRLELLALNFGDSLSLSPLFHELHRDLDQLSVSVDKNPSDKKQSETLKKRLTSLSKRVASAQLSSVLQHGQSIQIRIPLGDNINKEECRIFSQNAGEYKWPDDEVAADFGDTEGLEDALIEEIALRGWSRSMVLCVMYPCHFLNLICVRERSRFPFLLERERAPQKTYPKQRGWTSTSTVNFVWIFLTSQKLIIPDLGITNVLP